MAKKGNNAQEILVDIKAEASAQGAGELAGIAGELIQIAGAGNLAAETIQLLTYTLDTLQSNKGFNHLHMITDQLRNSFNIQKNIELSNKSKQQKRKLTNDNYSETVRNVAQSKQLNNRALSSEEASVIAKFKDLEMSITDFAKFLKEQQKQLEASATLFSMDGNEDSAFAARKESLGAAKTLLDYIQNEAKVTYWTGMGMQAAERAKRQQDMNKHLQENPEEAKKYNQNQVRNKELTVLLKELELLNKQDKSLRKIYKGYGAEGVLRSGLLRVQKDMEDARGVKGFAARGLGNLLKGTRLGDMFNLGTPGAGINLGTVIGGTTVAALAKLTKAAWELGKASLEAYGNIEKVRTNLGVVYGTQGEADSVFAEIAEYAIKSPFGVKETADQAVLLKQSGVRDYELMDTLKMVGDLAGGSQDKMLRISNALSQIAANGTAQARQLRSFTMAGIPVYEALSEVLDAPSNEVRSKVRKNEVSYDNILDAFRLLTGEGGSFYQAVDKGARTYSARKVNLEDTAELGKAEAGEIVYRGVGQHWLKFQEGFWDGFKNFFGDWNLETKTKQTHEIEDKLDIVDKALESEALTAHEIQSLKVYRMEVENQIYTKEQREQILSQNYQEKTSGFRDFSIQSQSANRIFNDLESLYNYIMSTDRNSQEAKDAIAKFNALVSQASALGVWSGAKEYTFDTNYQMTQASDIPVHIAKARGAYKRIGISSKEEYDSVTSDLWAINSQDKGKNFTREEKAYYGVSSRKILTNAQEKTVDLVRGQISTGQRLQDAYNLYEKTDAYKAEKELADKELIESLIRLADEIENLNLDDNKFAYLKGKTLDQALVDTERYLETESARELDINLEEDREILLNQLSTWKDVLISAMPRDGFSKSFEAEIEKALNKDATTETLSALIVSMNDLVRSIPDSKMQEKISKGLNIVLSEQKVRDIDKNKLKTVENTNKKNYAREEAYAPLIRRLTDSILDVSLYKSQGAPLGAFKNDRQDKNMVNNVVRYVKNNFDRDTSANIAAALLKQGQDWFSISEQIRGSDKKIKEEYWQIKDNKQYSKGRKQKGFIEQDVTRRQLEKVALTNGSAQASAAVRDSYTQMINKIDDFFVKSFTAQENFEEKAEILDAKRIKEEAIANLSEKLSPEQRENALDAIEKKYQTAITESLSKQLGVSQDIEYRERVTALTHEIKKATDGTKEYTEVYLEALRIYREELQETKVLASAITTFKEVIEQTTKEVEGLEKKLSKTWAPNSESKESIRERVILDYVYDEKNKEQLDKYYPGKTKIEIVNDLKTRKPSSEKRLADISIQDKDGKKITVSEEVYRDALLNEINSTIGKQQEREILSKYSEWQDARYEFLDNYNQGIVKQTGFSLLTDDFATYAGNKGYQQRLLNSFGVKKGTSIREWALSQVGNYNAETETFSQDETKISDWNKMQDNLGLGDMFKIKGDMGVSQIEKLITSFYSLTKAESEANDILVELSGQMKETLNGFAVDSISSTMEILGKNFVLANDATSEMGQNMRELASSMLTTIGPAMTRAGLEMVIKAENWGEVATGLGLAAAGGFLSWSGGAMSGIDENEDEDAQKEARLKSLADLLSDLLDQARTDAEYYERNLRHTKALSINETVSSRSVNDAVITPSGEIISTHPDDWLIATKTPETLGKNNASPVVTITIVNQSGDTVKVASTEHSTDEFGNIDVKAMIVAVTAEAVANGEMDGAFAQMQARQKGVSNSF